MKCDKNPIIVVKSMRLHAYTYYLYKSIVSEICIFFENQSYLKKMAHLCHSRSDRPIRLSIGASDFDAGPGCHSKQKRKRLQSEPQEESDKVDCASTSTKRLGASSKEMMSSNYISKGSTTFQKLGVRIGRSPNRRRQASEI